MTDILLVVDAYNWGGHHAAREIQHLLRDKFNITIIDMMGFESLKQFNYDLIMGWLDSAEEMIHRVCKTHKIPMASRIGGWKGIWRTCRTPTKDLHKLVVGVVCCNLWMQLSAKKVYPRNVVTIMNGVDVNKFKPPKTYAHGGNWLWVGRQKDEQKDYALLQKVDGAYKGKIKVIGQKRKFRKVADIGWPHKMEEHYQLAKGFVRTSRNEGSSNCLLEAMSCRLPVVATPTGIAPMVLDPRCLATSTDHIAKTMRGLNNRQYAENIGRLNRETIVARWQWKFMREPYREFFENCLE